MQGLPYSEMIRHQCSSGGDEGKDVCMSVDVAERTAIRQGSPSEAQATDPKTAATPSDGVLQLHETGRLPIVFTVFSMRRDWLGRT